MWTTGEGRALGSPGQAETVHLPPGCSRGAGEAAEPGGVGAVLLGACLGEPGQEVMEPRCGEQRGRCSVQGARRQRGADEASGAGGTSSRAPGPGRGSGLPSRQFSLSSLAHGTLEGVRLQQ